MSDDPRSALLQHVLNECRDDDVSLWSVFWTARYLMPDAEEYVVHRLSLDVIEDLLETGQIVAGIPRPEGQGFDRWDLPVSETMDRITRELDELGREPEIGEIVWFTAAD